MFNIALAVQNAIGRINPNKKIEFFAWMGQDNTGARVIPIYADGIVLDAQVQPVSPTTLQLLDGYSSTKTYLSFWITQDLSFFSIPSQTGQGYIIYESKRYNVVSVEDDFRTGWVKFTGVEVVI